ncbi:MAG: hypothetical protein EON94_11865 [Caulobacteraceae bacterium]|nr:MAG: hypothetical protein EON94_11865 [Caulobacteraceae bacterium]
MNDFIDLTGASGATYRFRRRAVAGDHLPIAGNFALVTLVDGKVTVTTLGKSNDLSRLVAPTEPPEAQVYTRLNVARAIRTSEHDDLAAAYPTAEVIEH